MTNQQDPDSTETQLSSGGGQLFDRVVTILERARAHVVRSVNGEMIIAYWLIGREIVEALQGGDDRAEYGQRVIEDLSLRLTQAYKRGFSITNLRYFRSFYLTYADRRPEIRHMSCGELIPATKHQAESGILPELCLAIEKSDTVYDFSSKLGWSHYRELMKVDHANARLFYEIEAEN